MAGFEETHRMDLPHPAKKLPCKAPTSARFSGVIKV